MRIDLLEQTLLLLKNYLSAIDVHHCGWGIDPYDESGPKDYPMAYGLFAVGFSKLYQVTQENSYLKSAMGCLERLRELSSESEHLCWGLPFSWKGFPAFHPSTITTAIAGEGFLEVYRQTGESSYRDDLYSLCYWLTEQLRWEPRGKEIACPWFAPQWPVLANNVASKVGALLWRVGDLVQEQKFKRYGQRALRYVRMQQAPEGFWVYGEVAEDTPRADKIIDNLHTAYTLEGLIDYYSNLSMLRRWLHRGLREQIRYGLQFYTTYLFQTGKALEKIEVMREKEIKELHSRRTASCQWRAELLDEDRFLVFYPIESRLWGYGAALTVLGKAYRIGVGSLGVLTEVFHYIKEHLLTAEGRFKYKSDDERCYIRHEAHVFNGLCTMVDILRREHPNEVP